MSLKQRLTDDMKTAMKAGEKDRLATIRLINAAIKQKEVDERVEMDDARVLAVLEKMVKQRKDSIEQFDKAGREDLSVIERAEMAIIAQYLPEKMGEDEIKAAIEAAVAETGASGPADMGKLMALLKPRLAGFDFPMLMALAKQGLGVTLLPETICAEAVRAKELEVVLPQWRLPMGICHAVFASRRGLLPAVIALMPPARDDGLGRSAGSPERSRAANALGLGFVALLVFLPFSPAFAAMAAGAVAALGVSLLAKRQIGGLTGDTLGATQILAETAMLLAVLAALPQA